jgi:hypothetical protein
LILGLVVAEEEVLGVQVDMEAVSVSLLYRM